VGTREVREIANAPQGQQSGPVERCGRPSPKSLGLTPGEVARVEEAPFRGEGTIFVGLDRPAGSSAGCVQAMKPQVGHRTHPRCSPPPPPPESPIRLRGLVCSPPGRGPPGNGLFWDGLSHPPLGAFNQPDPRRVARGTSLATVRHDQGLRQHQRIRSCSAASRNPPRVPAGWESASTVAAEAGAGSARNRANRP